MIFHKMEHISYWWIAALFCVLAGSLPLNVSQRTPPALNPDFMNDADAFNNPSADFMNFNDNANYDENIPLNRVRSPRGRRSRARQARQPRWQRKLYRLFPITMNGLFGNSYGYNQRYPAENNGYYGQLFQRGYSDDQQPAPTNFQPQSYGAPNTPEFYQNRPTRSNSQSLSSRNPFYNRDQFERANYNQQQLQPDGTYALPYNYNNQRVEPNENYLDRSEESNFQMVATGETRGTPPNTGMGLRLASESEEDHEFRIPRLDHKI